MPIYEYRCLECGNDFEKMLSFSKSDEKQDCPHCASSNTEKKMSSCFSTGGSGGGSCSAPSGSPFQ